MIAPLQQAAPMTLGLAPRRGVLPGLPVGRYLSAENTRMSK